jgi:hypothetical protein
MNNASFVPNFAGRHTALSCNIDALCFLCQTLRLSVKSPPSQRFFNTNAGRFFNQVVDVLKISQGFNGFVIHLMMNELDSFLTLKTIKK